MATNPPTPQEIDPAFRARAEAIYQSWHTGDFQFRQAIDHMIALENEAGRETHYAHQGLIENMIGMMYGYRADLDQSIRHFARSRDLCERANNRAGVVRAAMNLGESYRLKGDFPRARQLFRTAFDQAGQLNQAATQGLAASNEGQLLLSMNQLEAARERFEKALEIAPNIPEEQPRIQTIADCHQGLATYCLKMNDNNAAWKHALESMRLSQQSREPFMLGFAYRTMGDVLTALGHTPYGTPAVEPENQDPAATNEHLGDPDMYFQLSIEAFQDIRAEGEMARTVFAQGLSLMLRGQKMTASRKFYQAMMLFTKLGMKDDANKATQAQIQAQARL